MRLRALLCSFIFAIAIILGGCNGSTVASKINSAPQAAVFIPRSAPAIISLLQAPDEILALGKFSSPKKNNRSAQLLVANLLDSLGLDYRKQIKPWLGQEITLAITDLDFDRNEANGNQPGYLLAAATIDAAKSNSFLQEILGDQPNLSFETYDGVKLIYDRTQAVDQAQRSISAIGVSNDFVLFANHIQVLKNAINNAQVPQLNLDHEPGYQAALADGYLIKNAFALFDIPALSAWITNQNIRLSPDLAQKLTIALSPSKEGVIARTALLGLSSEASYDPDLTEPVRALKFIDQEAIAVAAGKNLNHLWEQVNEGIDPQSPVRQILTKLLHTIEHPLGLDLNQDVFPWVEGEYAVALMANQDNPQELDWLFVVEREPDDNTALGFQHVDEIARDQGLSVGNLPLLEQEMVAWTRFITSNPESPELTAEVKGLHATVGNYEIFTSSVKTLAHAIRNQGSILDHQDLKTAIAVLPRNNDGYFYLDWPNSQLLWNQFPFTKVARLLVQPILQNVDSVTIASEGTEDNVRRASIFINFLE